MNQWLIATVSPPSRTQSRGIRPGRRVVRPVEVQPVGEKHAWQDGDATTACGLDARPLHALAIAFSPDSANVCQACAEVARGG